MVYEVNLTPHDPQHLLYLVMIRLKVHHTPPTPPPFIHNQMNQRGEKRNPTTSTVSRILLSRLVWLLRYCCRSAFELLTVGSVLSVKDIGLSKWLYVCHRHDNHSLLRMLTKAQLVLGCSKCRRKKIHTLKDTANLCNKGCGFMHHGFEAMWGQNCSYLSQ